MIFNIYSWIFPAALFTAAGLSNLTSGSKHKRNPARADRNKIIWFSINISIALGFLMVSAFIIDWSGVIWSRGHLYFGLAVFSVFYLSFMMRFIIGIPLILFLTAATLFLNVYLQSWNPASGGEVLAEFRILSKNQSVVIAEIYENEQAVVFVEGENLNLVLDFESIIISRYLFFTGSDSYYRMITPQIKEAEPGVSEKIITWLADNSFFLSRAGYSIDIGNQALLHLYSVVIDPDQKNISIGNL
ncbi:MAG: hypothetical protein KAR21_10475 [Spirochaetales bacterium]|nr:hypothetical protein [Spirochaetales bacterium]